jgi:hypothetical protein
VNSHELGYTRIMMVCDSTVTLHPSLHAHMQQWRMLKALKLMDIWASLWYRFSTRFMAVELRRYQDSPKPPSSLVHTGNSVLH